MASEKRAYTLTDIGTYLAWKSRVELVPLVQGAPELYTVYHVLEPNPKNAPRINVAGGRAFADFMVDTATQRLIGEFGRTRFGRPLFVPDAGKADRWVLRASASSCRRSSRNTPWHPPPCSTC